MMQLELTSNKKVIAKKPLTNLYEMNSSDLHCMPHRNLILAQTSEFSIAFNSLPD